jgi:hypothetical protein
VRKNVGMEITGLGFENIDFTDTGLPSTD